MKDDIKTIGTNSIFKKYYTSSETKKILKISDCKLAHLRVEGKLEFKKVGNRFLYLIEKN